MVESCSDILTSHIYMKYETCSNMSIHPEYQFIYSDNLMCKHFEYMTSAKGRRDGEETQRAYYF